MTGPRMATYVGAVETRARRFKFLEIVARKSMYFIGSEDIQQRFNNAAQASLDSAAMAEPLGAISKQVAFQETNARAADPNASVDTMTAALTLNDAVSIDLLTDLAERGATLRRRLTPEFEKACRLHGFLSGAANEPELTFQESTDVEHVLWDLMYDDPPLDPLRWEAFWGFRVPITHWVRRSRSEELRFRHSLFAGIHEELPFAEREVEGVAERLQCGPGYPSVAAALRASVRAELIKANRSEEEADAWLASHREGWLQDFLIECTPQPNAARWKQKQLVEILRSTQRGTDLLHFACHSTSAGAVEADHQMTMNVGGEDLVIQVGTIIANLGREVQALDAGPFVFLNACRDLTAQREFQPAPFATAWIECGAQAVISAVCPVPDFFAHAFALKYYDFLFGRAEASYAGEPVAGSLGGSLLATRRYFMEQHKNPLGLAYVLYAPSRAHLIRMRSGA